MGELLSAYSLIFAAITALYSLWYPEINNYIAEKDWPRDENRINITGQLEYIKHYKNSRMRPLLWTSIGILLIFFPAVVEILISFINDFQQNSSFFNFYDPIDFCLIFLFIINIFIVKKIAELVSDLGELLRN